jgi:hypothetical protein
MDTYDGVFRSRLVYQPHENRVYRELTQPGEDKILAENAELRKTPPRDMEHGRWVGQIPLNHWEMLCRKYPDLLSPDSKTVERAIFKVLMSPEGAIYRVRPRV